MVAKSSSQPIKKEKKPMKNGGKNLVKASSEEGADSKKAKKGEKIAQNPLILRCHRLMEAFAKSDDERDFLLDRKEGFIAFVDLDRSEEELEALYREYQLFPDRYVLIPKLTFYEIKKVMEGFANEKVYDIDTKEKLLEIIQSKSARENFLDFLYDHLTELEKWQQYYNERFRVKIIEWLRTNHFEFVFEEDLDLPKEVVEKVKSHLFEQKVGKDIENGRKSVILKSKSYYSNEALNPRPKRGRPPKQVAKSETEPQLTGDFYTLLPSAMRPFLFAPEQPSSAVSTFSAKFESGEAVPFGKKKKQEEASTTPTLDGLNASLAELRILSSKWLDK